MLMGKSGILFIATAICIFISIALLVYGIVPDDMEEEDIYGYRLTKRKRLLEEGGLYATILPLIQIFAHHFKNAHNNRFIMFDDARERVRDKLVRSGYLGAFTPNEFWGVCVCSSLGLFFAVIFMTTIATGVANVPIALIFGGTLGMAMPYMQLDAAVQDRIREIERRLPYSIDLLVLSMRAGLDFMTALDRVVARGMEQSLDDPMIQELGVVLQEMRVGTARADALINLCERVKSDYLKSMVGSILQSEKRGSPLAKVLEIQVNTIRNKRTQKIEKAASLAAVKILGPLMLIFGSVLVIIIGSMGLKMYMEGNV
jgi:tight adherence protein C